MPLFCSPSCQLQQEIRRKALCGKIDCENEGGNCFSNCISVSIWQARPDLVQAFQQAAASSSLNRGPTGTSPQGQPRSRGAPDERAARAVNEVRKKAAARGLHVRPQAAAPNQSIPPVGDFLSLINSGVAGKAPLASTPSSSAPRGTSKAAQTAGKKAGTATAAPKSVPVSAVANGPVQAAAPDASGPSPIGLGNGLGGLESKKKKSKSKNAS